MKIAVLTTCENDFNRFANLQNPKTKELLVKIQVLSDLKKENYSKSVCLIESRNVTDYVIKLTQEKSLVNLNFTHKDVYEKI